MSSLADDSKSKKVSKKPLAFFQDGAFDDIWSMEMMLLDKEIDNCIRKIDLNNIRCDAIQ